MGLLLLLKFRMQNNKKYIKFMLRYLPDGFYRFYKLYKLNRLLQVRLIHLIKNQFPRIKKCTICGWEGKMFIEQTRCPICFSLPRHRLMGCILNENNINNKNILIIGPDMPEILLLKKLGNNKVIILNKEQSIFSDIVSDITNHQIKNNSFDIIIMWHVLEHIEQDVLAVENVYNLLIDGGIFLFSVPIYPLDNKHTYIPDCENIEERELVTGHPDHIFCCGEDYAERFIDVYFKSKDTISAKNYIQEKFNRYHLDINHLAWRFIK